MMIYIKLTCCTVLPLQLIQPPTTPFLMLYLGLWGGQLTVVESHLETAWVDGAEIACKAGPVSAWRSPAKPGHASSTEGFSAAGHRGEGAWHLISYHSEFCSCHECLATEKQSRDDGCCWTQLGFHVTVAVPLYQTASRLIQNDIPLQTSVPIATDFKNINSRSYSNKMSLDWHWLHYLITFQFYIYTCFAPKDPAATVCFFRYYQ